MIAHAVQDSHLSWWAQMQVSDPAELVMVHWIHAHDLEGICSMQVL